MDTTGEELEETTQQLQDGSIKMANLDEAIQSARQALAGHATEDPGRLKLSGPVRRPLFRRCFDREAVSGVDECNQLARQTLADGARNEFHRPEAAAEHGVYSLTSVEIHDCALSTLPASVQFDTVVSPANSYGKLDGGFDDAISRAFSPRDDYLALTRVVQTELYEEWRGFAPPGTCTLLRMPESFRSRSKNIWGTKYLALCPTMRVPMNVTWDRENVG